MESQPSTPEADQESEFSIQSPSQPIDDSERRSLSQVVHSKVDSDVVSSSSLTSSGISQAMEPFPLLLLPLELIHIILRPLPYPDRLRSRANRMLYELESEEEFDIEDLTIGGPDCGYFDDGSSSQVNRTSWAGKNIETACNSLPEEDVAEIDAVLYRHDFERFRVRMKLDGPREAYVEGLKKMATNVKIYSLSYKCEDVNDQLIFPYIRNLRAERIWVTLSDGTYPTVDSVAEAELTEDHFDEWINGKNHVTITAKFSFSSGEHLHTKFIEMENGQSSLAYMELYGVDPSVCIDLFQRIGITYIAGQFHSTRRDAEVYLNGHIPNDLSNASSSGQICCVIGGKMMLVMSIEMIDYALLNMEILNENRYRGIRTPSQSRPIIYSN